MAITSRYLESKEPLAPAPVLVVPVAAAVAVVVVAPQSLLLLALLVLLVLLMLLVRVWDLSALIVPGNPDSLVASDDAAAAVEIV
jgi:hypothetical protein